MRKITFLSFLLVAIIFITSCNRNVKQVNALSLASKPNIIYILADDLGYGDVGFNGQTKFSTPNIDHLAKEGMVFTNHYSGSTVCAPSRSTLLTGQHTGHTPVRGNKEINPEGQWPMPDSCFTLPEMFKEAGYITGAFGKWGLGYPGSEGDPNNQGFDEFYGYNCQRLGHHYYPYHLWDNQEKVILEENADGDNVSYAPNLIHEKALSFLEENRDTSFFMYYPSIIPHAELYVPESYMEKFRGNLEPEIVYEGADKGDQGFRKGGYGSQAECHAAFAGMITLLDEQVGEIMHKLEELGIEDNTLVIFTSDNGPHREGGADPDYFNSNGQFKGYKRDLYEGGIHVPMIACWPGKIAAGSSSDHISAFWDMMPTFAELIDCESPKDIDGISMLPSFLGKDELQKKHDYLYWEFHERGGRVALRKDRWKAVRYNVLKDPNSELELYDLSVDPSEKNNLADEYPEIVKELMSKMDSARTTSDVFIFGSKTLN